MHSPPLSTVKNGVYQTAGGLHNEQTINPRSRP